MDVTSRLDARALIENLPRLGFRLDDATAAMAAAAAVRADERALGAVADMVRRIEERGDDVLAGSVFGDEDRESAHGRGVLPMLALVATAPEAVRRHTDRGITEDVAWASVADLGQQVWVHRRVHGTFGLHNEDWLGGNWAGGLVRLGRLQFDVEGLRADLGDVAAGEPAWFCHIPEDGPLAPADVDASLALARQWLPRWYPEVRSSSIFCDSWLLAPELRALVPDEGNIARFADRFERLDHQSCGRRDALYFGFHREPPCDLAELPRDTSFHRAVGDHLRGGGTFQITFGRLS